MGKPKRPRATKTKKPAKPRTPKTKGPKATHLALPLDLANKVRAILGQLPHDQINDTLVGWSEHGRPVNLGPVAVPDTGTE